MGLLAGCGPTVQKSTGGPGEEERPAPGATATGQIEALFNGYYKALGNGNFQEACDRLAPTTQRQLIQGLRRSGARVASCPQGMSARDPRGRPLLNQYLPIIRTAKISRIQVRGDRASIRWRAKARGKTISTTQSAQKLGAEWKLTELLG
jgi:hypothetical protein